MHLFYKSDFIAPPDTSIEHGDRCLKELKEAGEEYLSRYAEKFFQDIRDISIGYTSTYQGRLSIPAFLTLTPSERLIEAAFVARLQKKSDQEILKDCQYIAQQETGNPYAFGVDTGRRLSGIYKDPFSIIGLRRATRYPGSVACDVAFQALCRESRFQKARILMGSQGSGKTLASQYLANQDGRTPVPTKDGLYDRIPASVEELLQMGKHVELLYVHRDLEEAMESTIWRATATGRTEIIPSVVRRRWQFQEQLAEFHKMYANDPRVTLGVLINDGRPEQMRRMDVGDFLKNYSLEGTKREFLEKYTSKGFEILNRVYHESREDTRELGNGLKSESLCQLFWAKCICEQAATPDQVQQAIWDYQNALAQRKTALAAAPPLPVATREGPPSSQRSQLP